jgi:hypothetical protein
MTKEELRQAIRRYYGDTSRPPAETRGDLIEMIEDMQMMVSAIDETEVAADEG